MITGANLLSRAYGVKQILRIYNGLHLNHSNAKKHAHFNYSNIKESHSDQTASKL